MTGATRRQALQGLSAALVAGAAPRAAWGATQADVVVIGAGLAGLNAASLLEAAGLRVLVIEAEPRIGGRCHTLDDLPGRPEAGGIQVGQGYRRLRALAARHDIAVIDGPGAGAGIAESGAALYRIGDTTVTAADWPASPANRTVGAERASAPGGLSRRFGARLPALAKPIDWMDAAGPDPSLRDAYAQMGASEEALRLIGTNLNGNSLAGQSSLYLRRTAAIYRAGPGPTGVVAGGSQRLPEAMARSLKGEVRLRQLVTGIEEHADGVTIRLANGRSIAARHVICTIPFAALRAIPIASPLPTPVAHMIAELPYTRASFAYLAASTPFWREDGLPETLWTDDPLLGRVFVLGSDPPMLKVWTTGPGADLLDRMPADRAATEIVARIEAARPSARGRLRLVRRFSWQSRPTARGIYHHFGSDQGPALAAAARAQGRRLHFAGEHLAWESSGMEGALESGERVANAILTA